MTNASSTTTSREMSQCKCLHVAEKPNNSLSKCSRLFDAECLEAAPNTPPLSSRVGSYSTLCEFEDRHRALRFLSTLAMIVEPFMQHHGLLIKKFYEIHPNLSLLGLEVDYLPRGQSEDMASDRHSRFDISQVDGEVPEVWIGLKLRTESSTKYGEFLSLESVLSTLCHELAHLWDRGHGLAHFRKWWDIAHEVETDLGGRLRIERGEDSLQSLNKFRWMAWEDERVPAQEVKGQRKPSVTAIAAARLWESRYWNFTEMREWASEPKKVYIPKEGARGQTQSMQSCRATPRG